MVFVKKPYKIRIGHQLAGSDDGRDVSEHIGGFSLRTCHKPRTPANHHHHRSTVSATWVHGNHKRLLAYREETCAGWVGTGKGVRLQPFT